MPATNNGAATHPAHKLASCWQGNNVRETGKDHFVLSKIRETKRAQKTAHANADAKQIVGG
eukprot:11179198-Lingulodinium_polyedra.AAC.1